MLPGSGKCSLIMTIPVALKSFLRIVVLFQLQELRKLRVGAKELIGARVPVVGEVVATAEP
jgi:hypothetical protein